MMLALRHHPLALTRTARRRVTTGQTIDLGLAVVLIILSIAVSSAGVR